MPNNQLQFSPESDEYLGIIPPEISKIIIYLILLIVISGVIYMYFGRINNISSSQFILIPMGGVKKVQSFHYGKIVKILVDVNDQVKKDAVLFEIKSNEVILELSEIEKYNNALKRLADDLKLKTEYYDGEKEIKRMMIKQYEKEDNLSRRLRKSEINRLRKLLSNYQNDLEMLQMELKIRKTQYLKNKNLYSQKEILENDFNNSELSYKKVKNEVRKITREIAQLSKEISLKEEEALKISTLLTEKIVTNKKELNMVDLQKRESLNHFNSKREEIQASLAAIRLKMGTSSKNENVGTKQRIYKVKSPCDGIVTQVVINTIGGVVSAGSILAYIAPESAPIEVESYFPKVDIGTLKEGQKVQLKYDAYPYQKYGLQEGVVFMVSANAIRDASNIGPRYRVIINLNEQKFISTKGEKFLRLGMTGVAEVITSRDRIIAKFIKALSDIEEL